MPIFKYTAKDSDGITKEGVLEAESKIKAAEILSSTKLTPITILEDKKRINLKFLSGVKGSDLVTFTRQLATMVTSGLPLSQAMQTLQLQTSSDKLKEVLRAIRSEIEAGSSLSQALEQHPDVFSPLYVNLVRVGEASGKLDQVLNNLADSVERSYTFRSNLRAAMIYPALVTVTMIGVFIFLVTFVVPQLAQVYESFDADLPLQTRLIIAISDLFVKRWWLVLIVSAVVVFSFLRFRKTESGKRILAKISLKLPVFGNLLKEIEVTEFTRTLGLLVGSGVPILESLEIVSGSMRNLIYQEQVVLSAKQVEKGISVGVALSSVTDFPPMLTQMVSVGEETGKLDEVLTRLADFMQSEVDLKVKNLSAAIEPIILVALGAMVGFLVISIVLPIYQLTSVI